MKEIAVLFRQRRLLPLFFALDARKKLAASGKCLRIILLSSSIAGLSLIAGAAQAAADEDVFLEKIQPPLEQTLGQGRSALWTIPDVATQYQPLHPTPEIQAALQAQREGRFLDALIVLEEAVKSGQASPNAGEDAKAEMNLLRSSFLLQGSQTQQALEILAPLLGNTQHAADAYALTAMARLQQGQMREALEAAQRAKDSGDSTLPNLAMSYALQGTGRLTEAREVIHGFNSRTPQAVTLAREAELALMLDQVQSARALVAAAQESWGANPYVVAVDGLTHLMEGHSREAKAAFEAVLRYDPKDTKSLLGLGLAEIQLGNLQAGQKKLEAANETAPGNALILTYLGRAQQQSGQMAEAMASWRSAEQADPKDPTPWLYQAQAEMQANRLVDAKESLREAQARAVYRQVYRGQRLLREDEQLLQANLAETQRRLGMESIAFHTLADSVGEKSAASLRNQADLLRGQRFGESARRSLLLQSLFNERPGNLPAALDVYGDGAGQTGASTPQHGAVSELSAQEVSYNNYDELFGSRTTLEADAVGGSKNTRGEQVRAGIGNGTVGIGIAQRRFKTDGFATFEDLDNRIAQATVQWRPTQSTQAFVSHETFRSQRGETFLPASAFAMNDAILDDSHVTRLGLRHSLTDESELRGLWSYQQTDQTNNYEFISMPISFSSNGSSSTHSAEVQYRRNSEAYATQWGVQQSRGQLTIPDSLVDTTLKAQQLYAAWQQTLNQQWQLDAELGFGKINNEGAGVGSTYLKRWLPKLGMIWTPESGTHVRLAAWQGMGVFATGDATLAPASLAGFLLTRPDDNGKLVRGVSLGADKQLSSAWLLAAQAQRRKTEAPYIFEGQQYYVKDQIDEPQLAVHWQPQGKQWITSLVFENERMQHDPDLVALDSVNEQKLRSQQLAMRWLAGEQWTVHLAWSHNRVAGTQHSEDSSFAPILVAYEDGFNQLDADLNWQFVKSGSLTAGVRNAADTRFQYMDIDRLNPRFSNGRLAYAKLKLAW